MDQPGHIAMSGGEITANAMRTGLTLQACKDYFYGISTIFPIMMLGHYYSWMTEQDDSTYMERFVPAAKERFSGETMALLNLIYDHPDEIEVWRSALSSYISVYPYQILSYFTQFTFGPDAAEKMEQFAIQTAKRFFRAF